MNFFIKINDVDVLTSPLRDTTHVRQLSLTYPYYFRFPGNLFGLLKHRRQNLTKMIQENKTWGFGITWELL
jgi:hypothetical protein